MERRRHEEEEQERTRWAGMKLEEETKQGQKAEAELKKEEEDSESGVARSAAIQDGRNQLSKFLLRKETDPVLFPAAYLKECTDNFSESQKLGSGGFGAVFFANDAILKQNFVVKRPDLNNSSDDELSAIMESFKREIAVSVMLSCE